MAALVAVKEGVGAGESAARPPVSRPEPARARSWRVVGLGRRVARGGRERETKPSPTATNTSARTTVPAPERRVQPLAVLCLVFCIPANPSHWRAQSRSRHASRASAGAIRHAPE